MIVSNASHRSSVRGFHAFVMTCALFVLPVGMAIAQKGPARTAADFGEVAKRLKAAVDAGELTTAQATVMMEALSKTAVKKSAAKSNELESAIPRIKSAVEAGGITREALAKKIEAAVKAGKLTPDEAKAKLAGIKKAAGAKQQNEGKQPRKGDQYAAFAKKIEAAVKAGKLTEAEAKAKLSEIKKDAAGAKKKDN